MNLIKNSINRNPLLSYIIVNWNGLPVVLDCLNSIKKYTINIPYEVIIVDNCSDDSSCEYIKNLFPEFFIFKNKKNEYFAAPTNLGIKKSRGQYIFLLNNDIILTKECVKILISQLKDNHDLCAVCPQLLYPNGTIQPSCRRFPTLANLFIGALNLDKFFPHKSWKMIDWNHSDKKLVLQPMMSALMIKRSCILDVGYLDEKFPLYFNDVDWCYRAFLKGKKILFEPRAKAIHLGQWSGKKLGLEQRWHSVRSLYHFFLKHHIKSRYSFGYLFLLILCSGFFFTRLIKYFGSLLKNFFQIKGGTDK